jgi:hypothetical protein
MCNILNAFSGIITFYGVWGLPHDGEISAQGHTTQAARSAGRSERSERRVGSLVFTRDCNCFADFSTGMRAIGFSVLK